MAQAETGFVTIAIRSKVHMRLKMAATAKKRTVQDLASELLMFALMAMKVKEPARGK